MSTKARVGIKDPLGGGGQVNVMESGLRHCADSYEGGREGTVKLRFGAPGDPLEKSAGVRSGYTGRVPDLQKKFLREKTF
jgi:hypothetical protein